MVNNQVILRKTNWSTSKDSNDMFYMMNYEDGIKDVFRGKNDRLNTTSVSWMIEADNKNIGFINLVVEKANYNFLFLDMGIIKDYRGKGYGKKFLKEVQELVEDSDLPYVLMETKKDNINANIAAREMTCFITEVEDRNVYLLQKSRLQEFIDSNQMEELAKHYDNPSKKKQLFKDYY